MKTLNTGFKKLRIFLLIICCSCHNTKNPENFVVTNINDSNVKIIKDDFVYDCYILNGKTAIDNTDKNKHQLTISGTTNEQAVIGFDLNMVNLDGLDVQEIEFYGRFMSNGSDSSLVKIELIQVLDQNMTVDSLKYLPFVTNGKWENFTIHKKLTDNMDYIVCAILFNPGCLDDQLTISEFGIRINGKPMEKTFSEKFAAQKDHEFDTGSQFYLSSADGFLKETLTITGKIWGFLKYYHPEITKGAYNWDYELFRILPDLCKSENRNQRNKILNKWVERYETINKTSLYSISDSSIYSQIIDLSWLSDTILFDKELINKLNQIKNADRSDKLNYYLSPENPTMEIDFFKREGEYKNISWEDQGFRLLTLYKIWNHVEYCYPYKNLIEEEWSDILKNFISEFLFPENELDYKISILKLCAYISDSHVYLGDRNRNFLEEVLSACFQKRKYFKFAGLVKTDDGAIAVQYSFYPNFKKGDIIKSIDGIEPDDILQKMRPLFSLSNKNENKMYPYLLSSGNDSVSVECIRNGEIKNITIKENSIQKDGTKTWEDYNFYENEVIYIKNDINIENQYPLNDSKGMVIDLRVYGCEYFPMLEKLLMDRSVCYLWTSKNDKKAPGNFKLDKKQTFGQSGTQNYKGKVMILVNEMTISRSEAMAMALRCAPNSFIIGNISSGANGTVVPLQLPGGLKLYLTALGVYYPDWKLMQKNGVTIDIPVDYTLESLKEGSDLWIEKALEQIQHGKCDPNEED